MHRPLTSFVKPWFVCHLVLSYQSYIVSFLLRLTPPYYIIHTSLIVLYSDAFATRFENSYLRALLYLV